MVEVKRKKGETFDALLRRYQGRLRDSGLTIETKRRRFLQRHKSQTKRRAGALRREFMKSQYAYLSKTGQLKEEQKPRSQRRP